MRRICLAGLAFVLLAALCLPVRALTPDEVLDMQSDKLDLDGLERAAVEQGGTAEYGASLDEGLAELIDTGTRELSGIVRRAVRSGVLILVILLFCGLTDTMQEGIGKTRSRASMLAGTLAVTAVAVSDVNSLLGMGTGAISNIVSFANVLLPTVAALTAATGAITGAAARQLAAALFSDVLVNLIHGLLVPLLYGYIAASAAQAAVGADGLKRLGDLLKWAVTTVLTIVTMVFVGYLTASGIVAGRRTRPR